MYQPPRWAIVTFSLLCVFMGYGFLTINDPIAGWIGIIIGVIGILDSLRVIMKKAFVVLIVLLVIIAAYSAVDKTIVIKEPGLQQQAPVVAQPVAPVAQPQSNGSDVGIAAVHELGDAMEREQNQNGLLVFGIIIVVLAVLLIFAAFLAAGAFKRNDNAGYTVRTREPEQLPEPQDSIPTIRPGQTVRMIDRHGRSKIVKLPDGQQPPLLEDENSKRKRK